MKELQLFTNHLFGKMFLCFVLAAFTMGCEKEELDTANVEVANASVKSMNTVKITSTGMNFIAPDEIPSGWSTFSYHNKGHVPHFFILVKLPEGESLASYYQHVTIPFNNYLKFLRGEDIENSKMIIASWFKPELFWGGTGIIDAGETAITSLNLPDGNYVLECYVKAKDGNFHSVMGMLEEIRVTGRQSKSKEPKADINISIDGSGLNLENNILRPGLHTFSVDFADKTPADVHLVKIENPETADRNELQNWIYWGNNIGNPNEGLMTPAPANFRFLGGSQEVYNGGRAYFQAVLKPGTYALISEVPDPINSGHYVEFEVK